MRIFYACDHRYANHVKTFLTLLISNGMFESISTYSKINTFSPFMFKASKCSDPLSLLPNIAMQARRIVFVHSIYFWFPFYCACTLSKEINASIHPVRNWKMRCFIILKIKSMFPPWPSKSFVAYSYIVHLHNTCKREVGSRGGGMGEE